jgi:hypothetical protein
MIVFFLLVCLTNPFRYLKWEVSKCFGEVVGLHGVPTVEVLPLKGVHLQGECHHLPKKIIKLKHAL